MSRCIQNGVILGPFCSFLGQSRLRLSRCRFEGMAHPAFCTTLVVVFAMTALQHMNTQTFLLCFCVFLFWPNLRFFLLFLHCFVFFSPIDFWIFAGKEIEYKNSSFWP